MKIRRRQANPDKRKDNAERIQKNINMTKHNMEAADEMIAKTSDAKTKAALQSKNARRQESIASMRSEMRDETKTHT